MRRFLALPWSAPLCALALTLALGGCKGEQAPAEPVSMAPERIESPALRIAIVGLPGGFDVTANSGETLRLAREPGLPPGEAWIEVGAPVEGGINLVEVIRGQREAFEALPGGSFSGNGELVLQDGRPAYYSRGRFDDAGETVEEFRVRSVHPLDQNRLLTVYYRYPAAEDSKERLDDVLLLVGEIEGLGEAQPSAPATALVEPETAAP
jgi:hypothetical protein